MPIKILKLKHQKDKDRGGPQIILKLQSEEFGRSRVLWKSPEGWVHYGALNYADGMKYWDEHL